MFRNLMFRAKMRRPNPEDVLKRWRVVRGDTVYYLLLFFSIQRLWLICCPGSGDGGKRSRQAWCDSARSARQKPCYCTRIELGNSFAGIAIFTQLIFLIFLQVKKHSKQTAKSRGGIITKEASVHASRVALIDPSDKYAFCLRPR